MTTVSRLIPSPGGGFAVAIAIVLVGTAARLGVTQPSDRARDRGQRAESFLRQLDANRNGLVEANELSSDAKAYLERTASRYEVPMTLPLSIEKFRDTVVQNYERVRGDSPRSGRGPGPLPGAGPPPGAGPSTSGFGAAPSTSTVSGFGSSGGTSGMSSGMSSTSGMSSSASMRPSSTGSSAADERYRSFAANMLKRYDKNGNGVLDREEWSQLRGEWFKSADTNGDGTITVDEIVGRLAGYRSRYLSRSSGTTSTTSGTGSSSSSSTGSSYSSTTNSPTTTSNSSTATSPSTGNSASSPAPAIVRKPHRFLTPTERLPSGLPDWFARKDANGDGQVTLAEFSDSLSDEVVAEFARFDLNNDGTVTPQECLNSIRGR